MTITKNDFFTANNFKTLQDIGKKYPEWKDFCEQIVNQMDDKFGYTMLSETSAEAKQLFFLDQNMLQSKVIEGITAADLQKDKLYLYKLHATIDGESAELKSKELYNTGVNIKPIPYTFNKNTDIDGKWAYIITIQDDVTYNVGDTLLALEAVLLDGEQFRCDYNGALYEVVKIEGDKVYLQDKDNNVNTPFQEVKTLYLYKKK